MFGDVEVSGFISGSHLLPKYIVKDIFRQLNQTQTLDWLWHWLTSNHNNFPNIDYRLPKEWDKRRVKNHGDFDSYNNNFYFDDWNSNSELSTKEEWESF